MSNVTFMCRFNADIKTNYFNQVTLTLVQQSHYFNVEVLQVLF